MIILVASLTFGGALLHEGPSVVPGAILEEKGEVLLVDNHLSVLMDFSDISVFTETLMMLRDTINRLRERISDEETSCNDGLKTYLRNQVDEIQKELAEVLTDRSMEKRPKRPLQ